MNSFTKNPNLNIFFLFWEEGGGGEREGRVAGDRGGTRVSEYFILRIHI